MLNKDLLMIGKAQTSILSIRIRNDLSRAVLFKIVFKTNFSSRFEAVSKTMNAGEVLSYIVDLKDPTVSNYNEITFEVYYVTAGRYDVTISSPDEWFGKWFNSGLYNYRYYECRDTLKDVLTAPNIDKGYLFSIVPYN